MRASPSIVPRDDDHDVYLVMDDFGGRLGLAWRETAPDSTDFETVIRDLLDGQYSNPVRVVGLIPLKALSSKLHKSAAGLASRHLSSRPGKYRCRRANILRSGQRCVKTKEINPTRQRTAIDD